MINIIKNHKLSLLVILISVLISSALGYAIWDINFWPTDTKVFYFDAAVKIPHLQYLSEIHRNVDDVFIRWLHGKELFILFASIFQRLINDFTTIRPFIIVDLISICISSILIYFVARRVWGRGIAVICFVLFAGSVWPYVYILFAKHQPLGLVFFLLSVSLMNIRVSEKFWLLPFILSGACMGAAMFASTVSSLYVPYYCAGLLYFAVNKKECSTFLRLIKHLILCGLFILFGASLVFVYVNAPNIVYNVKSYIEYVQISGAHNHFYYNQPFLVQWFQDQNVEAIRGGMEWIVKYFFVIMPVLFPLYAFSVLLIAMSCLIMKPLSRKILSLFMIFLSMAAPLMAEIAQVAQYGANYFPSIIGIILLIGYGCFLTSQLRWWREGKRIFKVVSLIVVLGTCGYHIYVNVNLFLRDIYPTRMVTTFLSRKIEDLGAKKIYTYKEHPQRNPFVQYLNPETLKTFRFVPMKYVIQPTREYILVPPVTGDSIYIASISKYSDFSEDIFLNDLIKTGRLKDYAVASFPTLANSKIWLHEEEILSYRNLILGHTFKQNDVNGRVWLLDAKILSNDKNKIVPDWDSLDMFQRKINNIGTIEKRNIYIGYTGKVDKPKTLMNLLVWVYKVGEPTDALRAFVYKVGTDQAVLIPLNENYISEPFSGELVTRDSKKGAGFLKFDPPIVLGKGTYQFVIYRTGPEDDENYYRIRGDYLGILDK